jgi:UDP-N-acetylmuramyl pentapeptide phosphotransferase/UDP-N-acetylglucosamine-1-phosphate transferase
MQTLMTGIYQEAEVKSLRKKGLPLVVGMFILFSFTFFLLVY